MCVLDKKDEVESQAHKERARDVAHPADPADGLAAQRVNGKKDRSEKRDLGGENAA